MNRLVERFIGLSADEAAELAESLHIPICPWCGCIEGVTYHTDTCYHWDRELQREQQLHREETGSY